VCFLPLRSTAATCSSQCSEPALSFKRSGHLLFNLAARAAGRTLVEFSTTSEAGPRARMLEVTMNDPAIARPPERSRLAMIVAGAFALLGSFVVTAPAQAGYYDGGYYGGGYYGSHPCSYRCGYRSYAPRYYNGCGRCGCYRRCGSGGA